MNSRWLALPLLLVSSASFASAKSHATRAPTSTTPRIQIATSATPSFHAGSAVEIEWYGSFWPGRVIASLHDGRYVVSYDGYGRGSDEIVGASRLRAPTLTIVASTPTKKVEVEWNGTWYPAQVLFTEGERKKISYDGYGPEWDEFVTADRIRSRRR